MQSPNQKELSKWLDKLQWESWQLELVISGFAIFLMLGALEGIHGYFFSANLPFCRDTGGVCFLTTFV